MILKAGRPLSATLWAGELDLPPHLNPSWIVMMSDCIWEEIHGFQSPGEYRRFVRYIESQVQTGHAQEIATVPGYHRGYVFGGRWFLDTDSGEIWRLVPPDFPFRGVWEPVGIRQHENDST